MFLHIYKLQGKKLAGKSLTMSFVRNRTTALWQSFMPERNKMANRTDDRLYSVEVYDRYFFDAFDPAREFEKWAAVEIDDLSSLPEGINPLIIPSGDYAVFLHRGPAGDGERTYRYIFEQWLPSSGYALDNRPHFAVMDDRYKGDSPDSEEEIWIPVLKG